jgi:ligand-binding SRPBCC domain-containing protein
VFHTSRITAFERPTYFQDGMVRGMFRRFCHDHFFETQDDGTVMRDHLEFSAPFGRIGAIVEKGILEKYMISLLKRRNAFIMKVAESQEWVRYLSE